MRDDAGKGRKGEHMSTTRDKIRQLRNTKNLSQVQLAHLLGYNPSTVSRIEQGALKPSLRFMQRMADTFNLTLSYLLEPGEPVFLDDEGKFEVSKLDPGLRSLALDEELTKLFDITAEEIQRLALVRLRNGSVDKQGYVSLLLFLRNLDHRPARD
jgi:transcriptional regulator with XRE-family HTH domain